MRLMKHLVAGVAMGVATIAVGDAGPVAADHTFRATGAILTGANEVPGPGDPDGVGAAGVVINVNRRTICYFVAVRKIEPATLAHIHRGVAGVAGEVVVTLQAPSDGFSADCVTVDRTLAGEIAHNPSGFYVNVHNADFPAGAIRGQLH
jgi:CHRD domain